LLLGIFNRGPFFDERYLWSGQGYFLQSQRYSAKDQTNQQGSNSDCQALERTQVFSWISNDDIN
jgi:hypothetical protein